MTLDNRAPEFARIRLFVEASLAAGSRIVLSRQQIHYLSRVMRLDEGDEIRLFNGRDGEWAGVLKDDGRALEVRPGDRLRLQDTTADVTLAFSPIKKSPMEYLVEKATELGVRRLQPIIMERTQIRHLNLERLKAHAVEAAEQSWRLSVPEVLAPIALEVFVNGWSGDPILYCDERRATLAEAPLDALAAAAHRLGPWAVLIGPEGGFSPGEQTLLEAQPNAVAISLGPRIVRAETAAVMALTLWQASFGDLRPGSE